MRDDEHVGVAAFTYRSMARQPRLVYRHFVWLEGEGDLAPTAICGERAYSTFGQPVAGDCPECTYRVNGRWM